LIAFLFKTLLKSIQGRNAAANQIRKEQLKRERIPTQFNSSKFFFFFFFGDLL
jgi:hypothetical protein